MQRRNELDDKDCLKMLRSGDTIRLTSKERDVFAAMTGSEGRPAPTTVAEHNRALQDASDFHAQADTPEDKLLAALALDLQVE